MSSLTCHPINSSLNTAPLFVFYLRPQLNSTQIEDNHDLIERTVSKGRRRTDAGKGAQQLLRGGQCTTERKQKRSTTTGCAGCR